MTAAEVLDLGQDGIFTLLKVSLPLMAVALAVGLAIALLQALTQLQVMTLVVVTKIVSIFLVLVLSLPFMGQALGDYMTRVMSHVAGG
jgi:flagellar biosynthetic protein FliQ